MSNHEEIFRLCFLLVCLLLPSANSIDTITQNTPLRDGDVLVSQQQTFALGFFSPTNSSVNRYVGIWYNNVSIQTVVWILNRDAPINGTSGILSITENGNLALFDHKIERPIWSTSISETEVSDTRTARLLDTGNFVFYNDSNNNFMAWQGFDYPTNTWLPYMKFGFDRRTGVKRFLTSWRSAVDPGTGDCTFSMDLSGLPQMFLYRGSTPLWRGGTWNRIRYNGIANSGRSVVPNVTYKNDDNEITMSYTLTSNSVFSMLRVNHSGLVHRDTWFEDQGYWSRFWYVPRDICENYGICGAFGSCDPSNNIGFQCVCLPGYEPRSARDWDLRDASDGCVRKRGVQGCGNGDGFVRVEGVKLPDTSASRATRVDPTMEMEACQEFCSRNCTCVGYTSHDISRGGSGSGCVSWHGELWDVSLIPNGDRDLYIRVDAIELALYARNAERSNIKRMVAIIAPLFATAIFFLCLAYWFGMKKGKGVREQSVKHLFNSSSITSPISGANESATNTDLPFYSFLSVVAATNSFSFDNKLGEGGFGSVYKGQLRNGQEVAIKRLSANSEQGTEEFKNEVTLIAKLQHRNLVKLLGYCITKDEKMLIYEYMPNRGLDTFIFGKEKGPLVCWKKRFEITLGICRGMLYLHQDSRLRIIHRDLKASNVLLDSSMNPKISDFGVARIFRGEQMEATTKRVVGTYGYMSPEYAMEGLFSIKSDVFSFGVLLLEIISGRKNSSFHDENTVNIIGHVWDLWREGRAMEIVDSSLQKPYDENEVKKCIHVGLLCVQESAANRPSMSEVALMLSRDTNLPSPKQPAFIFRGGHESSSVSVYDGNITTVEGR